jgi:cytoskeleton protein RodZ
MRRPSRSPSRATSPPDADRSRPRVANSHNVGVDTGIGATLRDARNRRKVDLSEVEDAIKIRPRYLLALENEEWDVLPGGAYTRGFIRTYATYLGLDGERLADEYRRATAPAGGERVPRRIEPVPATARQGGSRVPGRVLAALVVLGLVALAVAIGLVSGGGSSSSPSDGANNKKREKTGKKAGAVAAKPGVSLGLAATGEVWVCLLDSRKEPLVEGQVLEAGTRLGPFRGRGFTMAFGNGEVDLKVDGKPVSTPPSNSPVGYEVGEKGKLKPLQEGERPTCE